MRRIGVAISGMPDARGKSKNHRYAVEDAALSAFSIFLAQSPSFLDSKTLNRHIAVTPVLASPKQKSVVALAPQSVQPQGGHDKQDCELAASGRWLDQWGAQYGAWGVTYLGGDLDVEALEAYVTANSPLRAPGTDRIRRLD